VFFSLSALPQRDPFTISYWEELLSSLKMFYNYIRSLGKGYENLNLLREFFVVDLFSQLS
jgi:hypothetical protein